MGNFPKYENGTHTHLDTGKNSYTTQKLYDEEPQTKNKKEERD